MSEVLPSPNVGVAARYAAQIRELLAQPPRNVSTPQATEQTRVSEVGARPSPAGPQASIIDLLA